MKIQALASGSNGNAAYLESGKTGILVDAGISCKRITEALSRVVSDGVSLSAVLVTHEHYDHINGLFILAKKCALKIYATPETCSYIRYADKNGAIPQDAFCEIEPDVPFSVGDFTIRAAKTSHDAVNSVCYRISDGKNAVGIVTDTGYITKDIEKTMQNLNGLLLESNHDVRMLEVGTYPYALKRRILGRNGHLSNVQASDFLKEAVTPDLRFLLLGHLSEENNLPELAELTAIETLNALSPERKDPDLTLEVLSRYSPSKIYEI